MILDYAFPQIIVLVIVEEEDEKNSDSGREHSYTFLGWSVVYGTTQFWGTIWHRYFIKFELYMTQ